MTEALYCSVQSSMEIIQLSAKKSAKLSHKCVTMSPGLWLIHPNSRKQQQATISPLLLIPPLLLFNVAWEHVRPLWKRRSHVGVLAPLCTRSSEAPPGFGARPRPNTHSEGCRNVCPIRWIFRKSSCEISRKALGAPSPGRLLRHYCTRDALGDGGWERFQRLSERAHVKKKETM